MAPAPRPLRRDDDRESFDCGRESLNHWFRRHAWPNHESGASRVFVVEDPVSNAIAGFVALSASQIERAYLPKARQRNQPDPVPVVLLGQLAVQTALQGRGYARSLLFFGLTTALRVSDTIGCVGVITHPLDERVRAFYARWGFENLPYDPKQAMIVRFADLRQALNPSGA